MAAERDAADAAEPADAAEVVEVVHVPDVPSARQPCSSDEPAPLHPSDCGGFERDSALAVLRGGEISVIGRVVEASNATLYCSATLGDATLTCVYKPVRGERPLWDFPDGTLAEREVAAFEVSEAMGATGGGVVPPTVLRDGPFGTGMVQAWIDVDETVDVVALVRSDDARLRRVALFDAVINNSDRKGGHVLPAPSGRVYGIDHGVTFHSDDKLRTVLWTWRGKKLNTAEAATLGRVRGRLDADLGDRLAELVTVAELEALRRRVDRLLGQGRFPMPSEDWPPVPWPPF